MKNKTSAGEKGRQDFGLRELEVLCRPGNSDSWKSFSCGCYPPHSSRRRSATGRWKSEPKYK